MWNKKKKIQYRKRKTANQRFWQYVIWGCAILLLVYVLVFYLNWIHEYSNVKQTPETNTMVELLTINPYSRPGTLRNKTKGVVIHYVANPNTSAKQNRDYFEGLKDSQVTKASSHYIVGLEGEIVQCIPLNEVAYASNNRNDDTISIEVCHPDETGKFKDASYDSLVKLTAWICGKYDIKNDQIIRHYDITGKLCPKYYVEHEDEWRRFKKEVKRYIKEHGE